MDSDCLNLAKKTWSQAAFTDINFTELHYWSQNALKWGQGKNTNKKKYIPLVCAHRFYFNSIFRCLLSSQVETQHLIGQLTNHRRAEEERLEVKQYHLSKPLLLEIIEKYSVTKKKKGDRSIDEYRNISTPLCSLVQMKMKTPRPFLGVNVTYSDKAQLLQTLWYIYTSLWINLQLSI